MWITTKTLEPTEESHFIARHIDISSPIVFFDIETTGFHRDYSKLVSISMIELIQDRLTYVYLFNETGKEEAPILKEAAGLLSAKYLISFNGDAFDIPYLMHKYAKHGLSVPLTTAKNLDLMKVAKACLHLDSYKLKKIEIALGIQRTDTLSGEECVEAYKAFIETGNTRLADQIALHNEEDTLNLMALTHRLLVHHSGVLELFKPHYFDWRDGELNLIAFELKGDFAVLTFEPTNILEEIHWYDERGHIFRTHKSGNLSRLEVTLPVEHHNVDGYDLSVSPSILGLPRAKVVSVDGHPLYENLPGVLRLMDQLMKSKMF